MQPEANTPITLVNARVDGETVGLRCINGRIAAIGPEVKPEPDDETMDAAGAPVVSALVNGDSQAGMTLFRGEGADLPMKRWLREKVWPVEARLEPDDVYWGARLACLEMIRSGTAYFWDSYWYPEATARAVEDAGLQATVGRRLTDFGGDTTEQRASVEAELDALTDRENGVRASLSPYSINATSKKLLQWVAEEAVRREIPLHIGISETREEVQHCIDDNGVPPAAYVDALGLLGTNTVISHGVWLTPAEIALIAERGATLVSNPVANMKRGVGGAFPYEAVRRAGIGVGLGSNGLGSKDSFDLFLDLKAFALLQRHSGGDPRALTPQRAWRVATGAEAPLLTGHPRNGSIMAGDPADFLVLRRNAPQTEFGDLTSNLVFAATGSVVEATIVSGRVLMREGTIPEEAEIVARAAERARRLGIGSP